MSKLEGIIKKACSLLITGVALLPLINSGCQTSSPFFINHGRVIRSTTNSEPRRRGGCFFAPVIYASPLDMTNLGKHSYFLSFSEKNGLIYTKKAGHIDIFHLRESADWTAFLAAKTFESLNKQEKEFSFKLEEPPFYYVKIDYPKNWENLPKDERERITYNVSLNLGQYFAYTATTWHEISTWFGYSSKGFISEFQSAFSWEDIFSNLLGTYVAVEALRDSQNQYDEAISIALEKHLEKLNIQPINTVKESIKKAMSLWTKNFFGLTDINRRNFDIGLDGFLTAWNPLSNPLLQPLKEYPVPNLDFLSEYGFSLEFRIEPREWEKGKILKIAGQEKYVYPERDFPVIMDYIRKDAVKLYGENVDKPTLD